jgi:antitoxin ChpS
MSEALNEPQADALLRPPSDAEVERALAAFATAARRHYGDRLKGLYLFGSRARGDNTPESDADVAVVLADDGWQFWDEKMQVTDLAFDSTHASGLYVQAWPFTEHEWNEQGAVSRLLESARKHARPIGVAA